jgi:hypothetical protein
VAHDKQTGEHPDHSNIARKSVDHPRPQQLKSPNHCVAGCPDEKVVVQDMPCHQHTSPKPGFLPHLHTSHPTTEILTSTPRDHLHKSSTENERRRRHRSIPRTPSLKPKGLSKSSTHRSSPHYLTSIDINLKPKSPTIKPKPPPSHLHNTHAAFFYRPQSTHPATSLKLALSNSPAAGAGRTRWGTEQVLNRCA